MAGYDWLVAAIPKMNSKKKKKTFIVVPLNELQEELSCYN